MNLKHVTDLELLKMIKQEALGIRERTLRLMDLLSEANDRKLYCDLGYGSLFKYIAEELKFSESQAAIYNNLIKSKVSAIAKVQEMIKSGDLTLFSASCASQVIRDQKIENRDEKLRVINSFKGLNKERSTDQAKELMNKTPEVTKEVITLSKNLKNNIEKLKKKLNLPEDMKLQELVELLISDKLVEDKKIQENKTITPKTKQILKTQARHHCQYPGCQETRYLEVDHVLPLAIGGTNHPSNLRIYCREHNQKAAMNRLGAHIIHKRTLPAK